MSFDCLHPSSRGAPPVDAEPLLPADAQMPCQQQVCRTGSHSDLYNVEDEAETQLTTTKRESALEVWQQWVPMNTSLHQAVQFIHLCMLQKVDELFENAGTPYWICGGTLLGAIRHSGLIPHDDDVDVECFESDLEAIAAIPTEPPFYTGFQVSTTTWEGHQVAKLQFFHGEFSVDVFPRPNDLPQDEHFPSRTEVFPLKRYKFHTIELWGPREPIGYLNRCYGSNWCDSVSVWNHDYNWYHLPGFSPEKTVLSLQDYNDMVKKAGIVPPVAESSAADSFETFCDLHGDDFFQEYNKYRFQRTWRQNRAAAEWREQQQQHNDTK